MLTQQDYAPDDILPEGKRSISAVTPTFLGGNLISVAETINSLTRIGVAMATSMGAWACRVDLIIQEIKLRLPLARKRHFTCIRLQLIPHVYYTYCAEGPGQLSLPKILRTAFSGVATSQTLKFLGTNKSPLSR